MGDTSQAILSQAALGGAATFTSPAYDHFPGAQSAAQSTSEQVGVMTTGFYQAITNVAGDLFIEVSLDGATWRRIGTATATELIAASGVWVALSPIPVLPPRYSRAVYVNGAGAQANFLLTRVINF